MLFEELSPLINTVENTTFMLTNALSEEYFDGFKNGPIIISLIDM